MFPKECIEDRYGLIILSIEEIKEGTDNDTYMVQADEDTYFLKLFDEAYNDEKRENLRRQFRVLEHVDENQGFDYDVNLPVRNQHGNNVSRLQDRYGWLSRSVPGEKHTRRSEENIRKLGRSLADYHEAIEDLTVHGDSNPPLDWLNGDLREKQSRTDDDHITNIVEDYLDHLTYTHDNTQLQEYLGTQPSTIVHGDFTLENVMFTGDEITGVIDFDNNRIAPAADDIGWTLMSTAFKDSEYKPGRTETLFDAYHRRNFKPDEKQLIKWSALIDLIAIANAVLDPSSSMSGSKATLQALHQKSSALREDLTKNQTQTA